MCAGRGCLVVGCVGLFSYPERNTGNGRNETMNSMIDKINDYIAIKRCNIDHVVALIMLEHISVFTNTFEGYVIRISHFNKRERWEITVDDEIVVIYFFPYDNYSRRVSIVSEAIDSLKQGNKR